MVLCIAGAGLSSEYLTLKTISAIMRADVVYIDSYTSIAPGIDDQFVSRLNPKARVQRASRRLLEDEAYRVLEEAKTRFVVVLVPGDPYTATTHIALRISAMKRGIEVCSIPGVSGLQAVIDATGLQYYRFGKTVTLVYPDSFKPYSVIETIWGNAERNLHTLVLLDLRLEEGVAMTIPEAIRILLRLEEEYSSETGHPRIIEGAKLVAVARAGLPDEKCVYGTPSTLSSQDYPPPPHSLIVPASRLHPLEEEALETLCTQPR